ncbi:MAG: dihydrolipoamide acetyltransferase family protein [Armatimonadota bacterium]|nr:dihydrolipoamide acetyltransferase family protein [Armatimonadota bacterium]
MAEVIMPKMGDAMTEGKVLRWLKQPGDPVRKGEPIAEIETDKVNVELEAEWDGVLSRVLVAPGSAVPVGAPIAILTRPGEAAPAAEAPPSRAPETPAGTGAPAAAATAQAAAPPPASAPPAAPPAGAVRASPLARRLAAEHGIPLETIRGSGPEGRITKEDVEAAIAARAARPAPTPAPAMPPAAAGREVPLSRMRATIARRMTESKQQVPHFYVTMAIAMDAALDLRRQLNDRLPEAAKVTVNDLVVRAAALALRRYPNLNASFAGDVIRHPAAVNISIAVPVAEGLVSPVLHDVDRKPLWVIAHESKALIERARAGHLRPDDLVGGTFTVSNLGPYGVEAFAAIVNPPQAAILAVGAATPTPVVRDGTVQVATVMHATLSADHRVTDGAEAAQFLGEIRRLLEAPVWLVTEIPEGERTG